MNPKKRILLILVTFWSVLLGLICLLLWQEEHQQQLNQQLIVAILREEIPMALFALEQGADANAPSAAKVPLWERIWNRLQRRSAASSPGQTPLILLLQYRQDQTGALLPPKEHLELVRALLAHGACADVADLNGPSALEWAITSGHVDTVRTLLEHIGNLRTKPRIADLLTAAIIRPKSPAIVALLLQHGADPNALDSSGSTPLAVAIFHGSAPLVRCLLAHHANPNLIVYGHYLAGWKPLEYARKNHLSQIARMLKDAGARE